MSYPARIQDEMLLARLKLWTDRLIAIRPEHERLSCDLAELAVVPRRMPPVINRNDSPLIIRIKERLLALHQEKAAILAQMADRRVELLDEQTLEVVLPGGPEPGSYLSWMPGEPCLAWWRRRRDVSAPRLRLKGVDHAAASPVHH